MRRLLFFIFFGLFFWHSHAQGVLDTVEVEQVTVQARRKTVDVALTKTKLDSSAFANSQNENISELLSKNSTVHIRSYGASSTATASFRGTASRHTQVLWNGMPINSGKHGISDFSLIPTAFVDNISLLHGGSSLTEGNGALGGSILLSNKPDWSNRLHILTGAEYGSFNTKKGQIGIAIGSSKIQYKLKLYTDQSENNFPFYNDESLPKKEDTLEHSAYNKQGVLQELYYKPASSLIFSIQHWLYNSDREFPSLMSDSGINEEDQKNHANRLASKIQYCSKKIKHTFQVGYSYADEHYINQTPREIWTEVNTFEESIFARYDTRYKLYDSRLILLHSISASKMWIDTNNEIRKTGFDEQRTKYSAKISAHYRVTEQLSSYALVRAEHYDNFFAPVSPSVGLEYKVLKNKGLRLHTSASRNYNEPSLNDLYSIPGGDPELEAEYGYTTDLGLNYKGKLNRIRFHFSSVYFNTKINNWILWEPSITTGGEAKASNIKEVHSTGFDNSGRLSKKWGDTQIDLRGNFSLTYAENLTERNENDDSKGKQLIYTPRQQAYYELSAKRKWFYINVGRQFTGFNYTTSSNDEFLYPYTLYSANTGITLKSKKLQYHLKAKVNNIFNADYKVMPSRAMPRRNYLFSLQIEFNK